MDCGKCWDCSDNPECVAKKDEEKIGAIKQEEVEFLSLIINIGGIHELHLF